MFDTECADLDESLATSISFKCVENTMYKRRRKTYPSLSRSPEGGSEILSTSDKFPTYKGMVNVDGDTALLFYSEDQRRILESEINAKISMDGTFKITPSLFYQIFFYVLKTDDGDGTHAFPVITVLMSGKSENLYREVLKKIKHDLPSFNPVTLMVDFERGSRNACREEFLDTGITGYWFHYRQAINRKIRKLRLSNAMKVNESFKQWVLKLNIVPLLPHTEINAFLLNLISEEITDIDAVKMRSLRRYVNRIWVQGHTPAQLSVFGRVDRTNNPAGFFNCGLSKMLGYKSHLIVFLYRKM